MTRFQDRAGNSSGGYAMWQLPHSFAYAASAIGGKILVAARLWVTHIG
jgi:hypothetical protein